MDPITNASASDTSNNPVSADGVDKPEAQVSPIESELPGIDILQDLEMDAFLQFGSREMTLREAISLSAGDVIALDRQVEEPVELVLGERIVARGEVVILNGNFALRITEVVSPKLRLEMIRSVI